MIVIEPLGGLANRMRALDSAINLGIKTKQSVMVLWALDSSLNCQYHILFERLPNVRVLNFINSHINQHLRKFFIRLGEFYFYNLSESEIQKFAGYTQALEQLALKRNLHIQTCGRFYLTNKPFNIFNPAKALRSQIETVTCLFVEKTIGIHIRRGDNTLSISHSPITEFIEVIKKELKESTETIFYLATDSLKEEKVLTDLFPGKIITHTKKIPDRNNSESIQDALVDLYCLSKCRKIIGSYYSSFSETAAQIGRIELIVVNASKDGVQGHDF